MGSVFFWTNRASTEVIVREASRSPSQLSAQASEKGQTGGAARKDATPGRCIASGRIAFSQNIPPLTEMTWPVM